MGCGFSKLSTSTLSGFSKLNTSTLSYFAEGRSFTESGIHGMSDAILSSATEKSPTSGKLALEVLALTRDSLLVALRFMDVALCQLRFVPVAGAGLATDGQSLFFDVDSLLASYKASREKTNRSYLHLVLHCVFHHPFASHCERPDCWDLACDVAVENIITEMGLSQTTCLSDSEQRPVVSLLKKNLKALTADRIYRYYLDQALSEDKVADLRKIFYRDDHDIWTQPPEQAEPDAEGDQNGNRQPEGEGLFPSSRDDIQVEWYTISERIQVDLDTVSRQWANRSDALTQNINVVNREHYDYRDFLNRFMVLCEAMQINDDEFDYVFYTHGFNLYKNMPLIEPLEYKDVRKMRDFVIAIDTSGSCSGDLVQAFIRKTCSIFQQGENFFQSFNIHVLQCDTEIQSAVKLTRLEDFTGYLKTTKLQGFGGTDFRPVFRYVDQMIASKEFTNLKGLIYFTDGYGIFPVQKPAYEAAFVFLSDEGRDLTVPPWAIKLVLTEEDLKAI